MIPKTLNALFILIFVFALLIAPTRAQDTTVTPTPVVALEAAPIAILTQEVAAPIAVDSGGGDVTLNMGSAPATSTTTDAASTTNPILYAVIVVMALLLVAAMIFGGYLTRFLATLVPPEMAASIYQSGMRMGLQVALDRAAQTSSPLDDEFFEEMARLRGLKAVKGLGGTYEPLVPIVKTPPVPAEEIVTQTVTTTTTTESTGDQLGKAGDFHPSAPNDTAGAQGYDSGAFPGREPNRDA